jgi:hypothetical protein
MVTIIMNRDASSSDPAIEKLKQDWKRLSAPDRALAIANITALLRRAI